MHVPWLALSPTVVALSCLFYAGVSCAWSSAWLSVPCPPRHSSSISSCKPICIFSNQCPYITSLILTSTLWGSEIKLVTQEHLTGEWQRQNCISVCAALNTALIASRGYLAKLKVVGGKLTLGGAWRWGSASGLLQRAWEDITRAWVCRWLCDGEQALCEGLQEPQVG